MNPGASRAGTKVSGSQKVKESAGMGSALPAQFVSKENEILLYDLCEIQRADDFLSRKMVPAGSKKSPGLSHRERKIAVVVRSDRYTRYIASPEVDRCDDQRDLLPWDLDIILQCALVIVLDSLLSDHDVAVGVKSVECGRLVGELDILVEAFHEHILGILSETF